MPTPRLSGKRYSVEYANGHMVLRVVAGENLGQFVPLPTATRLILASDYDALAQRCERVEVAVREWLEGKQSGECGHVQPHERKLFDEARVITPEQERP